MHPQPASESSPLNDLYAQFETLVGKKTLDTLEETSAAKIAKKYLLSLDKTHEGKVTFKAEKKPWGWGLWHAIQKRFNFLKSKNYNFETIVDKARIEFENTNLGDKEKALLTILNKAIEHVNETRKNKISPIIPGLQTIPAPPKPPPPPGVGVGVPKSTPIQVEKKLKELFPNETEEFIKFLAKIPAITNELKLSAPNLTELTFLVSALSEQFSQLKSAKNHLAQIQQSPSLARVAQRLGISTFEPSTFETSWEGIKSLRALEKEIPLINAKITLIELTIQLKDVSAKFDMVQTRAQALQENPFFSSFCEHVLLAAKPILHEITSRTFIDDPNADTTIQEPPFLDAASLERFKKKQEAIIAQYERALNALEGVQEVLAKDFKEPITSKSEFLKKAMGAQSIDEWTKNLEKAMAKHSGLLNSIRNYPAYTKLYNHLEEDVAELKGSAPSHTTNGLWHIVFSKQNDVLKIDALQQYSLDHYVNGLIVLCEGVQNAHNFYTQLRSAETHIGQIQTKAAFSGTKEFFESIFTNKRSVNPILYLDDKERKENALTRVQIQEHIQRYSIPEIPRLRKERIRQIEKSKTEFETRRKANLNSRQKSLLGQSPLCLPIRLSDEKIADQTTLLKEIDALKAQPQVKVFQALTGSPIDPLTKARALEPEPEETPDEWKEK